MTTLAQPKTKCIKFSTMLFGSDSVVQWVDTPQIVVANGQLSGFSSFVISFNINVHDELRFTKYLNNLIYKSYPTLWLLFEH